MRILLITALTCAVVGCGNIQHTKEISQPLETVLTAGVGETIVKINTFKSLPNAYGKADIFGRTTPTGLVTLQFMGSKSGKAIFVRNSIIIETGATTMNSTALVVPNYQTTTVTGNVGATPIYGSATTTGGYTVVPPNSPQAQILPQGQVAFEIDPHQQKYLSIEGVRVEIINASATELTYQIQR